MSLPRRITAISLALGALIASGGAAYYAWLEYQQNELVTQARAALKTHRWDELEILADRWTTFDPRNGEPWRLLAQAAIRRSEWSAAAKYLWTVPDTDPQIVQSMIELSKLSFTQLNDPLKGVDACERILRNDPTAAGAQQQLIWFYAMTLQREKLLNQIRAAIKVGREPREAYVYYFLIDSFQSADAVKLNERWLESAPDSELFLVARVLQMPESETGSHDAPAAPSDAPNSRPISSHSKRDLVNTLLGRFPNNLELLAYQGADCIANGDVERAAMLLSQALEGASQDNRFWRIKGWLHESRNELEEATIAYRDALTLHPLDWNTMNRLAVVERRRHNLAEVERLTSLVERAKVLRADLRKLPAVELVPVSALSEIAKLARDCGDQEIGLALERRLSQVRTRRP